MDQSGDEDHAGGDVLRLIGGMLANVAFGESQLVGENECFTILAQRLPPVLVERMDRHCEETELHAVELLRGGDPSLPSASTIAAGSHDLCYFRVEVAAMGAAERAGRSIHDNARWTRCPTGHDVIPPEPDAAMGGYLHASQPGAVR
jgi:hypothetical protein